VNPDMIVAALTYAGWMVDWCADGGALHVYAEWDTGGTSMWPYAAVCGVALVARIRIRGMVVR